MWLPELRRERARVRVMLESSARESMELNAFVCVHHVCMVMSPQSC